MSAERPATTKSIESKLRKLVDCVIKKARSDDQFARELEKCLVDRLSSDDSDSGTSKAEVPSFNIVTFLHEHGEEKLRQELHLKTDSDLRTILRLEGIARGKESKSLDRNIMITDLLKYAARKLNQGSAFLGDN